MRKIRVLFIYPVIQSSVTNTATYSLPLGLGAVATYCLKTFNNCLEIKILDGSMMAHEEQMAELEKFNAHIVGFSPTIASQGNAYILAKKAKELGSIVVFGGVNSTNLWQQMLTNRLFIDSVVLFEGEEAMAEIIRRCLLGKQGQALFYQIPNVAYRNNNNEVIGPEKIRVFNLDELPDIDYSLFDLANYFRQTEARGFGRAVSYYSGKGCSKRSKRVLKKGYLATDYFKQIARMKKKTCSFCGRNELGFRTLSPDRERRLLDNLHNQHGVKGFFNVQDTVSLYCDEPIGLDNCWFRLFIGVESITQENLGHLKRRYGSNLILQAGVESATPAMRRLMGKARVSEESFFSKVEMLKREKVQLHASFIFGARGETIDSMQASTRLIKQLANYPNCTWILISPQLILPGSPDYFNLLDYSGEMREKWANADLIDVSEINIDFLRCFSPELTRPEILDEIKSIFSELRSKTPERRLVLDIKGVLPKEEKLIAPRRYYCNKI